MTTRKKSLRKQGAKKRATKQSAVIPEKQWKMPAGFCSDGSPATLLEVVDPNQPTRQLTDLTLEQRAELVVKRMELQSKIELAMIGAGMIDKARAITEVTNQTKVGRLLIEIEHQMIRNLVEQAQRKNAAASHRRTAKRKTTTKRA